MMRQIQRWPGTMGRLVRYVCFKAQNTLWFNGWFCIYLVLNPIVSYPSAHELVFVYIMWFNHSFMETMRILMALMSFGTTMVELDPGRPTLGTLVSKIAFLSFLSLHCPANSLNFIPSWYRPIGYEFPPGKWSLIFEDSEVWEIALRFLFLLLIILGWCQRPIGNGGNLHHEIIFPLPVFSKASHFGYCIVVVVDSNKKGWKSFSF